MGNMQTLYESLQKRLRPEDVADLILQDIGSKLSAPDKRLLERAAHGSIRRSLYQMSSMMDEFRKPVVPNRQVNKAMDLFTSAYKLSAEDLFDPQMLSEFLTHICKEIQKDPNSNDFKAHRLDHDARQRAKMDISRRRYNKLFRFLIRFHKKIHTYMIELRKYRATMVSKSSLASLIPQEDFMKSRSAAYFAAYFTARANRRSTFTNKSQDRPFDEVAAMLLTRYKKDPCASGWYTIAHVMPDESIVSNLSDTRKMKLLAKFLTVMVDISDLLQSTYESNKFDLKTMVVSRGNDSSTWNALAGAWNAARHGWVSLLFGLGLQDKFNAICPGKVMRLMAADVVRWHQATGSGIDPNTKVWAELPMPWEVFNGRKECTREMIIAACTKNGVDAEKTGWVQPGEKRSAVPFVPTPELVHGVTVSNPQLALVLRKAGWFAGKGSAKSVTEAVVVERDETGAALGVHADDEEVKENVRR
jgi:hypothetical protein